MLTCIQVGIEPFRHRTLDKNRTMNILILALVLVPAVLAAPSDDKRLILDSFGGSLFDLETLKCDLQIMVDVLGGDPTEVACESECHKILQEGHVLNYGCPLVCHGFQSLIHLMDVTPDSSGSTPAPCTSAGRK